MAADITLKIVRSIPSKDIEPSVATYTIPSVSGMTVLDALVLVKTGIDHSLCFRHSCRMGNCGSCAVIANGRPILACSTQISEFGAEVEIRPLQNFPVIRDLVSGFEAFYDKHRRVKPYILRKEAEPLSQIDEYIQMPAELDRYVQFTLCIKCGLCFSACPITSTNTQFLGPHALSQAYRYLADSRDGDDNERLKSVDTRNGCWGCHFIGSCSQACPKGIDPTLGIQLLRRLVITERLGILKGN
jgi:succinate dehydrogenase / fumarate reductase iron-sulfur subunit